MVSVFVGLGVCFFMLVYIPSTGSPFPTEAQKTNLVVFGGCVNSIKLCIGVHYLVILFYQKSPTSSLLKHLLILLLHFGK